MNPGSILVKLTQVDFCSVNAYLSGLSPGKLNPPPWVGWVYPGSTQAKWRFSYKKYVYSRAVCSLMCHFRGLDPCLRKFLDEGLTFIVCCTVWFALQLHAFPIHFSEDAVWIASHYIIEVDDEYVSKLKSAVFSILGSPFCCNSGQLLAYFAIFSTSAFYGNDLKPRAFS